MNGPRPRRDLLVRSDEHRLMIHPGSPGTTSVPLRFFENPSRRNIPRRDLLVRSVFLEGRACHVRNTTLDHPLPFTGGLKSRAESGAKAPHSMECGDLSPLFGEGFSLHHLLSIDSRPSPATMNPSVLATRSVLSD